LDLVAEKEKKEWGSSLIPWQQVGGGGSRGGGGGLRKGEMILVGDLKIFVAGSIDSGGGGGGGGSSSSSGNSSSDGSGRGTTQL